MWKLPLCFFRSIPLHDNRPIKFPKALSAPSRNIPHPAVDNQTHPTDHIHLLHPQSVPDAVNQSTLIQTYPRKYIYTKTQSTKNPSHQILHLQHFQQVFSMAVVPKAIVVSKAKKPKSAPAHPPYVVMVQEAILALKERTGSSQYAIAKHIEEKQSSHLPQNFKKILLVQLKKLVANGKLVKVKNSFKLAPALKPAAAVAKKPAAQIKPKLKVAAATKPKPKVAKSVKPKAAADAKSKAKVAAKTKVKVAAKPKVVAKAKPAAGKKPAKVAKTAAITSPGKKSGGKVKKVVAKKPKSIKSPVKKAAARKPRK